MLEDFRNHPQLNKAVHFGILVLGTLVIVIAYIIKESYAFASSVLVNFGTGLASVTIVFAIYSFFNPKIKTKEVSKSQTNLPVDLNVDLVPPDLKDSIKDRSATSKSIKKPIR